MRGIILHVHWMPILPIQSNCYYNFDIQQKIHELKRCRQWSVKERNKGSVDRDLPIMVFSLSLTIIIYLLMVFREIEIVKAKNLAFVVLAGMRWEPAE